MPPLAMSPQSRWTSAAYDLFSPCTTINVCSDLYRLNRGLLYCYRDLALVILRGHSILMVVYIYIYIYSIDGMYWNPPEHFKRTKLGYLGQDYILANFRSHDTWHATKFLSFAKRYTKNGGLMVFIFTLHSWRRDAFSHSKHPTRIPAVGGTHIVWGRLVD